MVKKNSPIVAMFFSFVVYKQQEEHRIQNVAESRSLNG